MRRWGVYGGRRLGGEYVGRGVGEDGADWYKFYKCSEIDPTVLSGEEIRRIRGEELRRLILFKLLLRPLQSLRLLRRFQKFTGLRSVLYLLLKPFIGKKSGATRAEVLTRAVEHREVKSAAADLTLLPDEDLEEMVLRNSSPDSDRLRP